MRTFSISTLGCKVNQYESEQIATLLRNRGLAQVDSTEPADLRIINTCSVTIQAASKSRQTVRRSTRLPVLHPDRSVRRDSTPGGVAFGGHEAGHPRVIVTGCWATSDKAEASGLAGVDAVIGQHDNVAEQLDQLLTQWHDPNPSPPAKATNATETQHQPPPKPLGNEGWMNEAGTSAAELAGDNKAPKGKSVKQNPELLSKGGTIALPLLDRRQTGHQRAFLKVQDGCDAHCTYCIIPKLRPALWSKPVVDAVEEARRLVAAGHAEVVLTGIFLGAYGQTTALHRRQPAGRPEGSSRPPLGDLVEALCTQVAGLRRVRLSSLEPGDVTAELIAALRAHPQVVPHFHLPLQSGSDRLLRRMNRQYTAGDFLRMVEQLREAFDRPALTTDVIVGFPGESEQEFARTLEVVDRVRFIHIHAFPYSPRPGTAAARWTGSFVHGPVVNQRIADLERRARQFSLAYRQQFVGDVVEVLVERPSDEATDLRHGRCERYFPIYFDGPAALIGGSAHVRIDRVTPHRTLGTLVRSEMLQGRP